MLEKIDLRLGCGAWASARFIHGIGSEKNAPSALEQMRCIRPNAVDAILMDPEHAPILHLAKCRNTFSNGLTSRPDSEQEVAPQERQKIDYSTGIAKNTTNVSRNVLIKEKKVEEKMTKRRKSC